MKKNKKFIEKKLRIAVFFIIILLFSALFFVSTIKPTLTKEEILEKVKKFPEVQEYKGYPANVTFLAKDNLAKLAKDYPVIYGNITKDVYEIKFYTDEKGLLVLYDANQNKIIRAFEIIGVKIG